MYAHKYIYTGDNIKILVRSNSSMLNNPAIYLTVEGFELIKFVTINSSRFIILPVKIGISLR